MNGEPRSGRRHPESGNWRTFSSVIGEPFSPVIQRFLSRSNNLATSNSGSHESSGRKPPRVTDCHPCGRLERAQYRTPGRRTRPCLRGVLAGEARSGPLRQRNRSPPSASRSIRQPPPGSGRTTHSAHRAHAAETGTLGRRDRRGRAETRPPGRRARTRRLEPILSRPRSRATRVVAELVDVLS